MKSFAKSGDSLGNGYFPLSLFRDNPKHAQYPQVFKPVFEDTAREAACSIGYLEEIAHSLAPQFLTWAMTAFDWSEYTVVGFTSTFDQNVASLTMAKLIKDLYPDVRIVFGGANFDGEMGLEYFRAFPWIDYVVVGEGEEVFLPLVKKILIGQEDRDSSRSGSSQRWSHSAATPFKIIYGFSTDGPTGLRRLFRTTQ